MKKDIHIYKEKDSRNPDAEYYGAYLGPYGRIASIHSFASFPDGIVTMTVNPSIAYPSEVRQAFTDWKEQQKR